MVIRTFAQHVALGLGRFSSALSPLLDLCYPGRCVCCEGDCRGDHPLCPECADELLELEHAPYCPKCAAPLAMEGLPCPFCKNKGLYPFERILRLGLYSDPLRALIQHMKYRRRWNLGEFLADELLAQEPVKTLLIETDVLLAVPLHWRRQFTRGYNQAQVIARRLARRCGLRAVSAAARIRDTETQTHYSVAARQQNMRGAFALLGAKAIAGKHVVIVDDVKTSGATLQAVGRALVAAKPASLSALVIAVADPRHRDFEAV